MRRLALAGVLALAGCAMQQPAEVPGPPLTPAQARERIAALLPSEVRDRAGWSTDVYAAFAALRIAPSPSNVCAVVAVTEQESGFRADPSVPGLGAIAWREIDRRADAAGVPAFAVHTALRLASPTGASYAERIDRAQTERELSDIFDDFIGMVPLGRRFFADSNPVRTGGPMQVGVRFAEAQAAKAPYPYPVDGSIRHEVFTRRGGMYFGIAHLLDYRAPTYDAPLYRFADYNAGRWASRNAALQNAIASGSGVPLALDGDLVRGDDPSKPGSTEAAARVLGERLRLDARDIRSDLEHGDRDDLDRTALWQRVFALADRQQGRPLARAVVPRIELKSPKITRRLTTEWFPERVDERWRRCLARAG
ncbi:MAG: DUF1615 domain-containing protein [Betaproteobacteria bacterium]